MYNAVEEVPVDPAPDGLNGILQCIASTGSLPPSQLGIILLYLWLTLSSVPQAMPRAMHITKFPDHSAPTNCKGRKGIPSSPSEYRYPSSSPAEAKRLVFLARFLCLCCHQRPIGGCIVPPFAIELRRLRCWTPEMSWTNNPNLSMSDHFSTFRGCLQRGKGSPHLDPWFVFPFSMSWTVMKRG